MAKKKKYKGHYCKICGEIKANEQFTGKGHANHRCKKCSKKTGAQQAEEILSLASQEVMEMFTLRFRNNSDKKEKSTYFLDINYEDFYDDLEDDEFFGFQSEVEEGILLDEYDLDDILF